MDMSKSALPRLCVQNKMISGHGQLPVSLTRRLRMVMAMGLTLFTLTNCGPMIPTSPSLPSFVFYVLSSDLPLGILRCCLNTLFIMISFVNYYVANLGALRLSPLVVDLPLRCSSPSPKNCTSNLTMVLVLTKIGLSWPTCLS